ncbi:hypothetical protein ALC60_09948 [Trachymyrmex zeteki]|uniref:Double jelly roll-like domain-containing protein n=1 Tax=Mycetomoellerius zeteki TaxID=64791 RepID=A0A151WSY3_9HYME|nr:hypothetical protein ALC60_09948 [Trachymyrmex zeteki]
MLTFTLTGKNSVLAVSYFPAVDLNDADYELGLTDFETYYTLANVNSTNNKFYFDDDEIVISEGSYELHDIERYLKREILRSHNAKRKVDEDGEFPLVIRANNNTMRIVGIHDLYEYPLLQSTTKHSGAVKTATQLEKPRYVIFALQTGRKNIMSRDASLFDDCNLSNVKLYLNSEFYPYDNLNLDFGKKRYAVLFDMYTRFRKAYYGIDCFETLLNVLSFIEKGPFAVIDCSRQNESVKSATVDVRIEFDCKENVPASATAYCLIIHDRVIEYSPLSNVVRKIM